MFFLFDRFIANVCKYCKLSTSSAKHFTCRKVVALDAGNRAAADALRIPLLLPITCKTHKNLKQQYSPSIEIFKTSNER